MNILVLGGTGFIGAEVVRALLAARHRVTVLHRGHHTSSLPPDVAGILGDRAHLPRHRDRLLAARPDAVVDLIATSKRDAEALLSVFEGEVPHGVVASSLDVYRAWARFQGVEAGPPDPLPLTEAAPLRDTRFPRRARATDPRDWRWDYDKIHVEHTLQASGLPVTLVRLPYVWGPGDHRRRWDAYTGPMLAGARTLGLTRDRAAWRCTRGHVTDVATLIARAAVTPDSTGCFNVGTSTTWSELDSTRAVASALKWPGQIHLLEPDPEDRIQWEQDLVLAIRPEWRCAERPLRRRDLDLTA